MRCEVLYVSPHADDVAFSAAAQLGRDVAAGRRVTVLTLFEARGGRRPAELGDATDRDREDQRFCARLGIERLHADLPDALARDPRNRSPRRLFAPLGPREAEVVEAACRAIHAVGAARVVGPLGVGEHIDHQIAHAAVARAQAELAFYEDTPYVLEPFALARRFDRLGRLGQRVKPEQPRGGRLEELWARARYFAAQPVVRAMSPPLLAQVGALWVAAVPVERGEAIAVGALVPELVEGDEIEAVKRAAIADYASQWPLFFSTLDAWGAALCAYGASLGGAGAVERRWSPSQT